MTYAAGLAANRLKVETGITHTETETQTRLDNKAN